MKSNQDCVFNRCNYCGSTIPKGKKTTFRVIKGEINKIVLAHKGCASDEGSYLSRVGYQWTII